MAYTLQSILTYIVKFIYTFQQLSIVAVAVAFLTPYTGQVTDAHTV